MDNRFFERPILNSPYEYAGQHGELDQDGMPPGAITRPREFITPIPTKDFEFQLVYVNGETNLETLKTPDDTWKVRLIEEDVHRLMFDTEGV